MDLEAIRRRLCQARQRNQGGRRSPLLAEKSRVSRVLFDPPNHEENLRFVKREMEKAKREAENRWNFDFENEKPMSGRFEWLRPSEPLSEECLSIPASEESQPQASSDEPPSEERKNSKSNSCRTEEEPSGEQGSKTTEASADDCDKKTAKEAPKNVENHASSSKPRSRLKQTQLTGKKG